jgi:hypothetical protein
MELRVEADADGHRMVGAGGDVELVNRFLAHLVDRNFALATRRAYAYDLLSFLRFCDETGLALAGVGPTDVFDYLGWRHPATAGKGVRLESSRDGTGDEEPPGCGVAGVVRVRGAVRGPAEQSGPGGSQGSCRGTTPRTAGPSRQFSQADRRSAGGAATPAA